MRKNIIPTALLELSPGVLSYHRALPSFTNYRALLLSLLYWFAYPLFARGYFKAGVVQQMYAITTIKKTCIYHTSVMPCAICSPFFGGDLLL